LLRKIDWMIKLTTIIFIDWHTIFDHHDHHLTGIWCFVEITTISFISTSIRKSSIPAKFTKICWARANKRGFSRREYSWKLVCPLLCSYSYLIHVLSRLIASSSGTSKSNPHSSLNLRVRFNPGFRFTS
jgi:hypothetical protein